MRVPLEDLHDIRRFFVNYLHQDWSIYGETLEELFETNQGLGSLKEGVRAQARLLICSELDNEQLDQVFFGQWQAGYEPEAEDFEDWRAVLEEIVRLCDRHLELEEG